MPLSYIDDAFEFAGITREQLRQDRSLLERVADAGMIVTRGQANRFLLVNEIITSTALTPVSPTGAGPL